MSRPRKPTSVMLLKGAHKEHPGRWRRQHRNLEPTPRGPLLAEPPDYFTQPQRAAFIWFVESAPWKVLSQAERPLIELGAVLIARFRQNPREFSAAKMQRLLSILDHCGMTPAARTSLIRKGVIEDGGS